MTVFSGFVLEEMGATPQRLGFRFYGEYTVDRDNSPRGLMGIDFPYLKNTQMDIFAEP